MARLALASGAPVVPLGVWGMQRRWSRQGIRWTEGPVRPIGAVVIGTPIQPEGDLSDGVAVRSLTERVMSDIATLVDQAKVLAGDRASQS
jgi:hypothetical protein